MTDSAAGQIRGGIERALAMRVLGLPPTLLRRWVGTPHTSPEGFVLDLQSQALLRLANLLGRSHFYGDLAHARRRFEHAAPLLAPRAVGPVRVRDATIPGASGPRSARFYVPSAIGSVLLPALVWFHGGGFVLGSLDSHDGVCRALATQAGIVVVAVDYRLAPEHRFPAGIEDALSATRWMLENGPSIGVHRGLVAVGGDSAGGNLAAGVAHALRAADRRPAFQLLAYPATDATFREPSHLHFAKGYLLNEADVRWFLDHYIATPELASDARVSPIFTSDLSGLPPTLVLTAGFDPLRDEGRRYADRLAAAGVEVEAVCARGSLHGFLSTAGALDESARLLSLTADRLRRRLWTRS